MVLGAQAPGRVGRRPFFEGRREAAFVVRRLAPWSSGTRDLVLRPWVEQDVPALVELCNDAEIARWIPAMPTPYTEDDALAFVRGEVLPDGRPPGDHAGRRRRRRDRHRGERREPSWAHRLLGRSVDARSRRVHAGAPTPVRMGVRASSSCGGSSSSRTRTTPHRSGWRRRPASAARACSGRTSSAATGASRRRDVLVATGGARRVAERAARCGRPRAREGAVPGRRAADAS